MSSSKETDHVVISSSDMSRAFSTPTGLLARLKGRKVDLNILGKEYYQKSLQYDEPQLQRDSVKVGRKLDFLVLPMFLLQRHPIGKLIGCMLLVWGAVCMLQAAVFNFAGFFAIRFFLGMLEACVSPAFIMLTSMLWTREEQSLRSSYWLSVNGVSSILGALHSYGAGHATGLAVPQWKLIYLIAGALTCAWGFVILRYLPDGPHNARMLSEYERIVAVWRISHNQTGLKHSMIVPAHIKEALIDPKSILLYLMAICYGILNGGVTNFLSSIIKGFGFNPLQTSLLQTPGGAFEVAMVIIFGYLSQLPNMIGVTIMIACLPGLAGLISIMTISMKYRYALVGMCWMQNILGSPVILNWTLPGLNTAGHTKRSTVLGIYFVVYCAGNIIGPHFFIDTEVPRYPSAIKGLAGAYTAAIGLQAIYTASCFLENRQKQEKGLFSEVNFTEEAMESFEDLTDKQNKHFKYRI